MTSCSAFNLEGVDGNRTGFYFHPAFDDPAECLPPGVMPEPTFYTPNLWPDKDLPELRPRCREAAAKLVEVGRRLAAAVDWRCSQAWTSLQTSCVDYGHCGP